MIEEKQLDGLLAVIRFHNVSRNQDFDTDWISDLSEERIQEMVVTLYTYGYITYKKVSREHHTTNLCRLTPEGMKFCKEGGFRALEVKKRRQKINSLGWVIAVIASLSTIGAFIWQMLSR